MKNETPSKPISIQGYIRPNDQDKHGNVYGITLITDYYDKYIIYENNAGKELYAKIDQKISIYGNIIGEDIYSNPILEIIGFNEAIEDKFDDVG